jgi:hypothetical protein
MIKELLRIESDTVTCRPIRIPFDFANKKSIPKGKDVGDNIVVSPITLCTWFKLKPLLMSIDKEDYNKLVEKPDRTPDSELTEIIAKYDELLLDIVHIGIHNKPSEPPMWFREVLKDNCTWEDIYVLLNAILFRIGFHPFYNSITTIMKDVSPMTEAEIIAAQRNLESYKTNP